MRVEQTQLPDVGIRYGFCIAAGRQMGVLVHRDGNADLIAYAADDPEYVIESVRLPEERAALADLLAAPPGGSGPEGRTHHRVWELTEDTWGRRCSPEQRFSSSAPCCSSWGMAGFLGHRLGVFAGAAVPGSPGSPGQLSSRAWLQHAGEGEHEARPTT
jgi:TrkA domain protein